MSSMKKMRDIFSKTKSQFVLETCRDQNASSRFFQF